jgi:hypothetical protein
VFDSGQKLWKFKKTQHMDNHTDREVSQEQQQSTKPPFLNNRHEAKKAHILLQQARLLLPISSYFYQVLQCQLEDIHTPRPNSFLFTTSALLSMCMGSLVSLPTPHHRFLLSANPFPTSNYRTRFKRTLAHGHRS